jgi:two-component system, chemotaxis family, chemotaxis protein CheY
VETIMVVEDDADLQEALSEALQEEGYRVRSARNGREALQKLSSEENRPNLIVLDLMMPMMNGWEFLHERSRHSGLSRIPVLVLTASSSARPPQAAVVLRKPVQPAKLFETVRQALGPTTERSVARARDLPT